MLKERMLEIGRQTHFLNFESVYEKFMKGHFVIYKTSSVFSTSAIDQCHGHFNAQIKGFGLLSTSQKIIKLSRWMIAQPEVAHVLSEFQETAHFIACRVLNKV